MASDRTTVPIAPALGRMLDVVRAAGLPALLVGPHGIGKSQFLEAWARERGLEPCVLDLSLLEATDLTGMPYIDQGLTRFAPPATLPREDAARPAALILEELNRCDRSVRQPCLQLLTTRRLNDYRLPDGCFVVACVNPENAGYEVDALDPALASRFVSLKVAPDRAAWLAWARERRVFPGVVRFVEKFAQAFERAPPRTWEQAARILDAGLARGQAPSELEPLLAAVLQPITAKALLMDLPDAMPEIAPERLLAAPGAYIEAFRTWMHRERVDIVGVAMENLRQHLASRRGRIDRAAIDLKGLNAILDVVPPDLAVPVLDLLEEG